MEQQLGNLAEQETQLLNLIVENQGDIANVDDQIEDVQTYIATTEGELSDLDAQIALINQAIADMNALLGLTEYGLMYPAARGLQE